MAAVCRATLGREAYLFLEQFVVKGAGDGMSLGWHQDSGYLPFDPPHYVTAWIPLDDVDEENGTIYVLPYDRIGTRNESNTSYRLNLTTGSVILARTPVSRWLPRRAAWQCSPAPHSTAAAPIAANSSGVPILSSIRNARSCGRMGRVHAISRILSYGMGLFCHSRRWPN